MPAERLSLLRAIGATGAELGSITLATDPGTYVVDCRRCERVMTRQRLVDAVQWLQSHTHGDGP